MSLSENENGCSVAVIGAGYWGKNLVRNFHQLGVLKVICDKNISLLEPFSHQYPHCDMYTDLNDVLLKKDIDGVVIATPASTHYSLARKALFAQKHVFIEKPMALREENAVELLTMATKKKKILMVGHLLQYHPAFICLKELISHGELGRIHHIYSNRLNFGKIRTEENILWSFAPHDISMILSLAAEDPYSVSAVGSNHLHQKISDVTITHFHFLSGLSAHIFVSWLHPFKEQKLVVIGDRKMAVFDDTLNWQSKITIYPHRIRWENNVPFPVKADAQCLPVPQAEPLRLECEEFLNCISEGIQPRTDASEGLRVLQILNASQRSLDEHGAKISLGQTRDEQETLTLNDP